MSDTLIIAYDLDDLHVALLKYGKVDFINRRSPTVLLSVYWTEDGNLGRINFGTMEHSVEVADRARGVLHDVIGEGVWIPAPIIDAINR